MQLLPLVGFYWRRNQQLDKLVAQGQSGDSHIVVELAEAIVPLMKKYYPALNADGLLDDALTTLKDVLAPPENTTPQSPSPSI